MEIATGIIWDVNEEHGNEIQENIVQDLVHEGREVLNLSTTAEKQCGKNSKGIDNSNGKDNSMGGDKDVEKDNSKGKGGTALIQAEKSAVGDIAWDIYITYFSSAGRTTTVNKPWFEKQKQVSWLVKYMSIA